MSRAFTYWLIAFLVATYFGLNVIAPFMVSFGLGEEPTIRTAVSLFVFSCAMIALLFGMSKDRKDKDTECLCQHCLDEQNDIAKKKAKTKVKNTKR